MKYNLIIENSSYCNQNCKFCPHKKYYQKNKIMSIELFNKIINTMIKLNIRINYVTLSGMGEPFTDKDIFQKAKIAKKVGLVETYTNGKAITLGMLQQINEHFDRVYLSVHGDTPEEYEYYSGQKFDEIMNKSKHIEKVLGNKLIISNHPSGKLSQFLGNRAKTPASQHPLFNWGDDDIKNEIKSDVMHQKYCELLNGIVFRVDGSIGTCCSDWNNINNFVSEDFSYCMKCSNYKLFDNSRLDGTLKEKIKIIQKINEELTQ